MTQAGSRERDCVIGIRWAKAAKENRAGSLAWAGRDNCPVCVLLAIHCTNKHPAHKQELSEPLSYSAGKEMEAETAHS